MSGKHHSTEYRRNSTLRRQQVSAAWRMDEPVPCWRGRGAIAPGQAYDIGHRNPHGGEGLDNLAPEHRHRTVGCCDGNRRDGGRSGAAITNGRATTRAEVSSWAL